MAISPGGHAVAIHRGSPSPPAPASVVAEKKGQLYIANDGFACGLGDANSFISMFFCVCRIFIYSAFFTINIFI